jgi:hypothetical protein
MNFPSQVLKQCPLCTGTYQESDIVSVDQTDEAELIHLTCGQCRGALLALMTQLPFGMSSIATTTDLSAADAQRFADRRPFSQDDVLSFHQFITVYTASLPELFTKNTL